MRGLKAVIRELFPPDFTCDVCGTETFGSNLCPQCRDTVTFNDGATCPVCGRRTETNRLCLECKAHAPAYKKAVSAMVYGGGAVKLIHKFKDGGGYLKEYFADLLTEPCKKFTDAQAICYIPSTRNSMKKRGYNQAELLAKSLGERMGLPVLEDALAKRRETEEQKTLSRREREKNLLGAFKADKQIVRGKTLILVDDVLTTGATADAAVEALKKAGATNVYFATVASVEYREELLDGEDPVEMP